MTDGYLGSGKILARAIKKHGASNFTVEVIAFFDSREDLARAEASAVTEELVKDPQCMNIVRGGFGDWSTEAREKSKRKRDWLRENDPEWVARVSASQSAAMKRQFASGKRAGRPFGFTFAGLTHTPEVRMIVSENNRVRQAGQGNSQYGKSWITNGEEETKVSRELLGEYLAKGWRKGRSDAYGARMSETLKRKNIQGPVV